MVSLQNNGSSAFSLVAPFSNINLSPSYRTFFEQCPALGTTGGDPTPGC